MSSQLCFLLHEVNNPSIENDVLSPTSGQASSCWKLWKGLEGLPFRERLDWPSKSVHILDICKRPTANLLVISLIASDIITRVTSNCNFQKIQIYLLSIHIHEKDVYSSPDVGAELWEDILKHYYHTQFIWDGAATGCLAMEIINLKWGKKLNDDLICFFSILSCL